MAGPAGAWTSLLAGAHRGRAREPSQGFPEKIDGWLSATTQRAGFGERTALAALLEAITHLRPSLHRYCSRMTGSLLDGEDIVQAETTGNTGHPDRATAPAAYLFFFCLFVEDLRCS
jgi:hypothetical protein